MGLVGISLLLLEAELLFFVTCVRGRYLVRPSEPPGNGKIKRLPSPCVFFYCVTRRHPAGPFPSVLCVLRLAVLNYPFPCCLLNHRIFPAVLWFPSFQQVFSKALSFALISPCQGVLPLWCMPCYVSKICPRESLLMFYFPSAEICSHAAGKALGTLRGLRQCFQSLKTAKAYFEPQQMLLDIWNS